MLKNEQSRAHSPTFPSLHLRHNSFSNPSVALPTSQLILQPFHRFIYVTTHSTALSWLHLRHSSFSNPSFASPTSQVLHLMHLASRLWPSYGNFFLEIKDFEKNLIYFSSHSKQDYIKKLKIFFLSSGNKGIIPINLFLSLLSVWHVSTLKGHLQRNPMWRRTGRWPPCHQTVIQCSLEAMAQDINSTEDQYMSWIAQLVRALARRAKGPGSSPGPGRNFSL